MENMELPKEWKTVSFGDVLEKIIGGGTPSRKNHEYYEGDIPWMTVKDMHDFFLEDTQEHITDEAIKNSSTNLIKADSLVIATRISLGKIVVPQVDVAINQDLKGLVVNNDYLVTGYIFYWYRSISTFIESLGVGTTVKGIRLGILEKLPFKLAPLAEQKEIVRIIESHLQLVDQIKSRLDALPKILEQFRQSVLASAVSAANQEDQQTEEIYGKIFYFPKSWTRILLKEYCNIISGNAFKSSDFIEAGVPVIKISNIQYGIFEVKNQEYLPNSFLEEYENFKIVSGDLLMALTRPITNDTLKTCRYPQGMKGGLLNQRVCKFNFNEQYINTQYIEYLFQSPLFKNQVENNLSETLQPNLSPKSLSNFIIYLPPLEEQKEIVKRVENLFTLADQIESKIKHAQERVNLLTQSILAKAFRGEFTAQWREDNPDLISGENSAEALLKRIEEAKKKSKKK